MVRKDKLNNGKIEVLVRLLRATAASIPMGVVEAVNANIKALLRRGRGYRDLNYLLL